MGCKMELIKINSKKFIAVAADSEVPEVMKIGHGNVSTTFIHSRD
jgi:hypothetical protein